MIDTASEAVTGSVEAGQRPWGIALSPDEKELWLADGHNSAVHVFDMTGSTPKQIATIPVRDQPGWITWSLDGKHVWPSTGEIVDAKTKAVLLKFTQERRSGVGMMGGDYVNLMKRNMRALGEDVANILGVFGAETKE